jgi:hypothetical protein
MQESRAEFYNLKRDLMILGWNSVKAWSEVFGYRPDTVCRIISRYWGKPDARPRGMITLKVIRDLEETLKHSKRLY